MYQTLPDVMRPREGEAMLDYWMSFSPMAPFFGVDWRFAGMIGSVDIIDPVMAKASADLGDALEEAAINATHVAETTVEAVEAASEKIADDLTQIRGVGPKMAAELNALGITTLTQIAQMGERQIDELSASLSAFRDRPVRDDWVGQARALAGLS